MLAYWAGLGGCEEAVSGAKKKNNGGEVAYQRFNGVDARAMATTFAHGDSL